MEQVDYWAVRVGVEQASPQAGAGIRRIGRREPKRRNHPIILCQFRPALRLLHVSTSALEDNLSVTYLTGCSKTGYSKSAPADAFPSWSREHALRQNKQGLSSSLA